MKFVSHFMVTHCVLKKKSSTWEKDTELLPPWKLCQSCTLATSTESSKTILSPKP